MATATAAVNVNMTLPTNLSTSSIVMFRFIANATIHGPICLLGLLGNITAIIVLFKQNTKATTTIILKALTLADSLYLIAVFLLLSLRYINDVTGTMQDYMAVFPVLFRWFYPQLYIYRTMITWLTVLLTVDRYIAVCMPLHAIQICTRKRAWREVTLVIIVSLIYNLPRFVEYEMDYKHTRGYDRTPMASNAIYVFAYRIGLFLITMYIIPLVMLLVANTRLVITLKKAEKERTAMGNSHQHKQDITYMVIATVFFFFLANIPAFIAQLLWALTEVFKPALDHISVYQKYHSNISNILIALNSGINFVIYCMCSRHFRGVFLHTFRCGRLPEKGKSQGKTATSSSRESSKKTLRFFSRNKNDAHRQVDLPLKKVNYSRI